jgi:glutamine synthetase
VRHLALLMSAELGELAGETSAMVSDFDAAIRALESANLEENQPQDDLLKHAKYIHGTVVPAMDAVREIADRLEKTVADDLWPLPKYSEILFIK